MYFSVLAAKSAATSALLGKPVKDSSSSSSEDDEDGASVDDASDVGTDDAVSTSDDVSDGSSPSEEEPLPLAQRIAQSTNPPC